MDARIDGVDAVADIAESPLAGMPVASGGFASGVRLAASAGGAAPPASRGRFWLGGPCLASLPHACRRSKSRMNAISASTPSSGMAL